MPRKTSLFQRTAALLKITEGLRGIRVQNQRERIMLDRERKKKEKEAYDTRKAFYAAQHEQIKAKRALLEAQHRQRMLDLEREEKEARIAESKARTQHQIIRNQLDSVKLHQLDPALNPGGTGVYQCPICEEYYTSAVVNPDYSFCTNPGCNNAPLVKAVLNLN